MARDVVDEGVPGVALLPDPGLRKGLGLWASCLPCLSWVSMISLRRGDTSMWTAGETTGLVCTGGVGGLAAWAATAGTMSKRSVVAASSAKT